MMYGHIALELLTGFVLLFVVTKLIGKTSINQITPFEFISALVLGELVGNAIYDQEVHLLFIFFGVVLWAMLMVFMEWLEIKYLKLRKILEGDPSIVVKKGQIEINALKKNKLTINQLKNLLRQNDVFSIRDVEYAVLETNGKISVLKKSEPNTNMPVTLINDGNILKDNLKEAGYDEQWLQNELAKQGGPAPKDVFYAEWQEGEGLYLQVR